MELARLVRLLRNRWKVVLVVAVVGAAAAVGFSILANDSLESVYEAQISIRFEPVEGETIEDLSSQVEDQRGLAVLAAEDLLNEIPTSSISADTASARLHFVAQGSSREQAQSRAQAMLDAYRAADPAVGGDISQQLADYVEQAAEFEAEIASLQPRLSPAEETLAARHELLDLQIAAVQERLVGLTVADAGATPEEKAANAARRDELRSTLSDLQAEKAAFDPLPVAELNAEERLRLAALQRRLEILGADYERLALRTMGVTTSGTVEPPTIEDLTPDPVSPAVNGVFGFLGGGVLALVALAFVTRARSEVWLEDDLPMPVLGVVPTRRISTMPGPSWYDSSEGGKRKDSIQAIRTAVEGALDHAPTALAVLGDHVESDTYHALAVDMAASFASAGRTVLLIDADYSEVTDMTEFNVGEPTLETVLRLPATKPQLLVERMSAILDDAVHIRTDLAVLPSGEALSSPADAVAGRQFRAFLKEAMSRFDLVMVVAGAARSPTAQVLVQRVGSALLAVTPGKTSIHGVTSLVSDLEHQRVDTVGAIMIYGSEARVSLPGVSWTPWRTRARDAAPTSPEVVTSPVNRLLRYPFPGSKESSSLQGASLRQLAGEVVNGRAEQEAAALRVVEDSAGDDLGTEVLEALRSADRIEVYEPVGEYVVSRVEDLLTAVSGQANLSDELVSVILEYGFIPLSSVKGHRSVGEWLVEELRWELGPEQGDDLAREFARILLLDPTNHAGSLNAWLADQFFERHIERTGYEPEVWHLTSEQGTAQVLVHGRKLDKESLSRLATDVVLRIIDEHQRALSDANQAGDVSEIESLRAKLRELHLFEVALGALQAGTSEEARIRYPWKRSQNQPRGWAPVWTEGIRPNIAPVQRLGLLARPVLTDEELLSLEPTG